MWLVLCVSYSTFSIDCFKILLATPVFLAAPKSKSNEEVDISRLSQTTMRPAGHTTKMSLSVVAWVTAQLKSEIPFQIRDSLSRSSCSQVDMNTVYANNM